MSLKKMLILFLSIAFVLSFLLPCKNCFLKSNANDVDLKNIQWIKTGGPIGGMGYDVRIHPVNHDILYVTDVWGGVHKSVDGGKTWVQKNNGITVRTGPSGDAIPVFCLTINQKNPDLMWCGLQGYKAIYKSTDGGEHWVEKSNGIPNLCNITFRSFTFDPNNPDIVYAGCEVPNCNFKPTENQINESTGKIFKTVDGGEHWFEVLNSNALVRWILINPRDTNILYAATGIFDRGAKKEEGIWKTTDGGKTWFHINEGLENLTVGGLDMDPKNPDILYCAVGRNDGFGSSFEAFGGVLKSEDAGKTWKKALCWTNGEVRMRVVNIAPSDSNRIYAATDNRFFRSDDGGKTWVETRSSPSGEFSGIPVAMAIHPDNPDIVYFNSYNGGVYKTEDGGKTWVAASKGYTGAQMYSLSILGTSSSQIFTAGRSGVFKSSTFGFEWEGLLYGSLEDRAGLNAVSVNMKNPESILTSENHRGSIFKTDNRGKSWRFVVRETDFPLVRFQYPLNLHGVKKFARATTEPNIVYAGYRKATESESAKIKSFGIYKSEDDGETWQPVNNGLENTDMNVNDIAVHPSNPDIAYAVFNQGGIYKTIDGGKSWFELTPYFKNFVLNCIAIDNKQPEIIYVGTEGAGLYKSVDGGKTWKKLSRGLDQEAFIRSIEIHPLNSDILFIADWRTGVYVSLDKGESFVPANNGLSTRAVNNLLITSDGKVLYAATEGEGVFLAFLSSDIPKICLTAQEGNKMVSLSWQVPNDDLNRYKFDVYRSTEEGASATFTKINTEQITGNEFVDNNVENGVKYYYKIIGMNEKSEQIYSNIESAIPDFTFIIDGLREANEWPEVANYIDPKGDNYKIDIDIRKVYAFTFEKYLYIKTEFFSFSPLNSWLHLNVDLDSDGTPDYYGGFGNFFSGQSGTGWWNAKINPPVVMDLEGCEFRASDFLEIKIPLSWVENKREFNIQLFFLFKDEKENGQVDSTPWIQVKSLSETPWDLILPSIPSNINIFQESSNSVKITWSPSNKGSYDLGGYFIYRETTPNGDFGEALNSSPITSNQYIDRNLVTGKTYYYKIRSVDIDSNMSDYSSVVEITIPGDSNPPEISLSIPAETYESILRIQGKIKDDISGVKYLKVNGVELPISLDGSFSYDLTLNVGKNNINVEAEDFQNNKVTKIFTVIYIKRITLTLQIGNKLMYVNENPVRIDTAPVIIEGRTLLPIRWVVEPLGANVNWNSKERKVTISLNTTTIELWIGKNIAKVNGKDVQIDPNNSKVVPVIINSRSMLPVRFVSENLGCVVNWDEKTKTIKILYSEGG